MDKFSREKARRMDRVSQRGAEPASNDLRRDAEYFSKEELAALRRAESAVRSSVMTDKISENVSLPGDLSGEHLNLWGRILLSHPETRIVESQRVENSDDEMLTVRGNTQFMEELLRALVNLQSIESNKASHRITS